MSKEKIFIKHNFIFKYFLAILCLAGFFYFAIFPAEAMQFSRFRDEISDSREGITNVSHSITWSGSANNLQCIKIIFCTRDTGVCTVPANFSSLSASKGGMSGLTGANWLYDGENNFTNGRIRIVNISGGEVPAASVSLQLIGLKNPLAGIGFYTRVQTYSDTGCLAQVDYGAAGLAILGQGVSVSMVVIGPPTPTPIPTPVPPGGGGGGQIIPSGFATAVFKGKSYPGSYVTVLNDGKVAATLSADPAANFESTLTGLSAGIRTFGLWSEDKDGRKSMTLSFTAILTAGTITTFSGLFLPPTINLGSDTVAQGEILNVFGYSYPSSEVNIFVNSESEIVKKTVAENDGRWLLAFDTDAVELGDHSARAKAVSPQSEISLFSETEQFKVVEKGQGGTCRGADLNKDGMVNLVDFSILMYFWNKKPPYTNSCVDIKKDGKVNLVDFSILMYYWSK